MRAIPRRREATAFGERQRHQRNTCLQGGDGVLGAVGRVLQAAEAVPGAEAGLPVELLRVGAIGCRGRRSRGE